MKKKKKRSDKIKEEKRIKKYVRFLKKNPDWDYSAILDLLRFKLKMVRTCIKTNKIIVRKQIAQISLQIKEVEALIQRVMDDQYYSELMVEYEKKYGKVKYTFVKIEGSKSKLLEIKYLVPDELKEEAKEAHYQTILRSTELQKADLKKAFDLMAENIWNWWD